MEFISFEEGSSILAAGGFTYAFEDEDHFRLVLEPEGRDPVHLHLTAEGSTVEVHDDAQPVTTTPAQLAATLEQIIHRLHLAQFLLVPVGKWRNVFDAVAFSLASNEDWQAVDAAASVELNRRDPLFCGPGDAHLVGDLITALLHDAESPDQGLMLATTDQTTQVLIEILPPDTARFTVGSQALADKIARSFPASG